MTEAEHNDRRWLIVKYLVGVPNGGPERRDGWHVVRICPCHWGESVTHAYPDREQAEHARQTILSVQS